jgi:hypothetical protein
MKIKYIGFEPITNIFGNWKHGEIKEIPDMHFHNINWSYFQRVFDEPPDLILDRQMHENLSDKMERKNKTIIHRRNKK